MSFSDLGGKGYTRCLCGVEESWHERCLIELIETRVQLVLSASDISSESSVSRDRPCLL